VDVSADLTARARIRDAALRRFGQNGFAATTVLFDTGWHCEEAGSVVFR
jgi:hypothetical protein